MVQYVEVSAAPVWDFVPVLREFVASFCNRAALSPAAAARVALAAHELLENAVRYTTGNCAYIRVEIEDSTNTVSISVRNETSAAHVERLRELVAQIGAAEKPLQYYLERLLLSASDREAPGLGLTRVRAETDMNVDLEVIDSETVCLRAYGSAA